MSGKLSPRIEIAGPFTLFARMVRDGSPGQWRAVGLALAAILALGASSPRVLPGDRQEGCEALCLDCTQDGEDEGSFCNFLFLLCCEASGGTPHDLCGCRTELAAITAEASRRGP
ncbi:MAG TPA: hypothetical protein PLU22_07295 [Polyangiaceae bacterium]|mgnify:CR=1 FL=1|nr:hypothetical protein [Polyangiaceae bacterium]